MFTTAEMTAFVGSFWWPFIRVAALFSVLPVLGGQQIPMRIRVMAAFLISLSMAPLIGEVPAVEPISAEGLLVTITQVLIGVVMGFVVLLIFNAILLGAESIAITMGLGFALMSDPQNGIQIPVVGQFYQILATLLFLALNGHHAILQVMAESFVYLPLNQTFDTGLLWQLLRFASILFAGALQIALPAIITMLTVNLVMGVMTRASPQLNVFSVGFPVTMTVGFLAIAAALPVFGPNFEQLLADAVGMARLLFVGGP